MRNVYHFVVALGIAAVSLSSCSRSNYAFNNSAPAYLGSEQVHAPTALATETVPTVTTPDAALQVAEVVPARHTAHRATHRASAHATAKAEVSAAAVTAKAQIAKIDRKAFKKELKRQLAAAPQGTTAEGKSQLVAALLCFFLGGLGIHDFYLGRVGKGILQIFLTLLFGIGIILVIIDFIRILIGTEKPKNGEYAKKL